MTRALAILVCALAGTARADIFSPGPLAKGHAQLEGLANCTKCHEAGRELTGQKCLVCHTEIATRIAGRKGYHGRLAESERSCQQCHHDHHGRDFALVDWGPKGQKSFDHAKTGTPLRGKHAPVACQRCHQTKYIDDAAVRALLDKAPERKTFLGTSTACATCHVDEHRGQVGTECQKCHTEASWKPARSFNHARTTYPLEGKHRNVACNKCHARQEDPAPRASLGRFFVRYVPVSHTDCIDCHKDPHAGRFTGACRDCHLPQDWKRVTGGGKDRAFHDKTKYPLVGAHRTASCGSCHVLTRGGRSKFKGIPFAACTDCHLDAHEGQFAKRAQATTCDGCHTVDGFIPPRFELEDHARTRYALEGAHRAVACERCHQHDPRLGERVPVRVRSDFEGRGRPVRLSLAVLALGSPGERCEACHLDPHGGQFASRKGACAACHQVSSFLQLLFDHRNTRFPLLGKHAQAACGACHPPSDSPRERPVRYSPLDTACATCHADVHAAQFARSPDAPTDCARCHGADSWKKLLFVHQPPFTSFKLDGKHAKLKCTACHVAVAVGDGVEVLRYKPLPTACEACHVDFHKGAFRGFEP